MRAFCYYCQDTKVQKTWEMIGGSLGESHYCCTKEACQKREAGVKARRKARVTR